MTNDERRAEYETADAIVRAVGATENFSKVTLAKWHRAGLIPIPDTVALGRGKGSESRYPAGTLRLVIEILNRRHSRIGDIDDLAWELWWSGYAVPISTVRRRLEKVASAWDSGVKNDDIASELKDIARKRLPKSVGKMRKRVGRKNIHRVFMAMLSVVTDRVDVSALDQVEEQTLTKAFNLKRARTERMSQAGPFIQTDQHELMGEMRTLLRGRSLAATLAAYSDSAIVVARDTYQRLMSTMNHAGHQFGDMFRKGAFGFDALNESAAASGCNEQALLIVIWLPLMELAQFKEGVKTYADSEQTLKATDESLGKLAHLQKEVPAISKVLTVRKIGAALKNKKKRAKLNADLRRTRKIFGHQIDSSLAKHRATKDTLRRRVDQEGSKPAVSTNGKSKPK